MNPVLQTAWIARLKLFKEGKELSQKGKDGLDEYYAKIKDLPDLTISGAQFHTESVILRAQGLLRQLEGDKLWFNAVFAVYGNVNHAMIERDGNYDCQLDVPNVEGGELYKWDVKLM